MAAGGVRFNGSSQRVDYAAAGLVALGSAALLFSAWIAPTTATGIVGGMYLMRALSATGSGHGFTVYVNNSGTGNGSIGALRSSSGTTWSRTKPTNALGSSHTSGVSGVSYENRGWKHVAVYHPGGSSNAFRCWVNGVEVNPGGAGDSSTGAGTPGDFSGAVYIGASNGGAQWFAGLMRWVGLWQGSISTGQADTMVAALFAGARPDTYTAPAGTRIFAPTLDVNLTDPVTGVAGSAAGSAAVSSLPAFDPDLPGSLEAELWPGLVADYDDLGMFSDDGSTASVDSGAIQMVTDRCGIGSGTADQPRQTTAGNKPLAIVEAAGRALDRGVSIGPITSSALTFPSNTSSYLSVATANADISLKRMSCVIVGASKSPMGTGQSGQFFFPQTLLGFSDFRLVTMGQKDQQASTTNTNGFMGVWESENATAWLTAQTYALDLVRQECGVAWKAASSPDHASLTGTNRPGVDAGYDGASGTWLCRSVGASGATKLVPTSTLGVWGWRADSDTTWALHCSGKPVSGVYGGAVAVTRNASAAAYGALNTAWNIGAQAGFGTLGYQFPASFNFRRMILWNYDIGATAYARVQARMAAAYRISTSPRRVVGWDGSSTAWAAGFTRQLDFIQKSNKVRGDVGFNVSTGGHDITGGGQSDVDHASQVATLDSLVQTGKINVLFVAIGSNDISTGLGGADNSAAIATAINSYAAARKAAGWNKVIWFPVLSRSASNVATFNTRRALLNAAVRALIGNGNIDGVIPADQHALLGADDAWSPDGGTTPGTYYIADKVHLNDLAAAIVVPMADVFLVSVNRKAIMKRRNAA